PPRRTATSLTIPSAVRGGWGHTCGVAGRPRAGAVAIAVCWSSWRCRVLWRRCRAVDESLWQLAGEGLVGPGRVRVAAAVLAPPAGVWPVGPHVLVVAALAHAGRAVLVRPGPAPAADPAAPRPTRARHDGGV